MAANDPGTYVDTPGGRMQAVALFYWNGTAYVPSRGTPLVFRCSGAVTAAASTGEQNLAVVPIPAGVLGVGGQIRVQFAYTNNNNANTKTFIIRLNTTSGAVTGGATVFTASNTTNTTYTGWGFINNTATNAQQVTNQGGLIGATASTPAAGAIDTAGATYLNINGNKVTDGADTIVLVGWTVEVFRGGAS